VNGGPGGTTFAKFDNGQFVYATGGGGGSRANFQTFDGAPGFAFPSDGINSSSGGLGGTSGRLFGSCIGSPGGQGQGGRLLIFYTQTVTSATWNELLTTINNQFRSSYNRPPTFDEIDFWISEYTNSDDDLGTLAQSIASSRAFRSTTGAISTCGSRL
jgi:hypothetical protein